MRIIAGKLRSRKFDAPLGNGTRPTADRAKVALFNILQGIVENARVLDAFAGSGALSFEALSRGAAEAVLFETDAAVCKLLMNNAKSLGLLSLADIRCGDFISGAAGITGRLFDVVFLDPPYGSELLLKAVELSGDLLAPGGVIVAEHGSDREMPAGIGSLVKTGSRIYGAIAFSFYKRQEDL